MDSILTRTATPEQIAHAELAESEILELMNRLTGEGFDWRAVLTGAATATMGLLTAHMSQKQVPVHFARLSALTMHLSQDS